ncbi:MAG: AAA family ATPase [Bacteroidia bacterium]
MQNILNEVEIKNFKSIKNLKTDCARVNVFIGKPNVGKSNILEAISLLGAHYSQNEQKYLSEFIRYEEISNLFYDDDLLNRVEVNTDKGRSILRSHNNNINQVDLLIGNGAWVEEVINFTGSIRDIENTYKTAHKKESLLPETPTIESLYKSFGMSGNLTGDISDLVLSTFNLVKKYQFGTLTSFPNKFPYFLLPPNGSNLFTIVDHNKELRKEIAEIFAEYGLQFVAYKKENKFEIEKNIDGYVSKFHYSSMADTFQRLVFYFAAIDSNKQSVLILEEPEVHSFPPYTKELSDRIIDSVDNQFFITTHSPYLLQNLISNLDASELNVFITYFENYQTKIRKLTEEELRKVSQFSMDIFFNLNQFVPNA